VPLVGCGFLVSRSLPLALEFCPPLPFVRGLAVMVDVLGAVERDVGAS
jgi:hypothetical protein